MAAEGYAEFVPSKWSAEKALGNGRVAHAMEAALIGGTSQVIMGGGTQGFVNGAQSAAMSRLFNSLAHAKKERINLLDHEGVDGSHTIAKHVEKSDGYLLQRMDETISIRIAPGVVVDRYPSSMGTFTSLKAANVLVNMTIDANFQEIQAWLSSGSKDMLPVGAVFNGPSTVRVAYRRVRVSLNTGPTRMRFGSGNAVTVVLRRNGDFTNGYNVHTAYPKIK